MIRLFLFLLTASLSASASLAQSLLYNTDNRLLADTGLSISAWDTPPAYKGGENALLQDFMDQFHIPRICYELNLETRVIIHVYIDATGHCDSVKAIPFPLLRNKEYPPAVMAELERQTLDIFRSWVPARHRGRDTASVYYIPLSIQLYGEKARILKEGWLICRDDAGKAMAHLFSQEPGIKQCRVTDGWAIHTNRDAQNDSCHKKIQIRPGNQTLFQYHYEQDTRNLKHGSAYQADLWFQVPMHKKKFRIGRHNAGRHRLSYCCTHCNEDPAKRRAAPMQINGRKTGSSTWEVEITDPHSGTLQKLIYTKGSTHYNNAAF